MMLRCIREGYPDLKKVTDIKSFVFIEENIKIYIVLPFADLLFSNCLTYEQKQIFHFFLHFWRFDGKNCEKMG